MSLSAGPVVAQQAAAGAAPDRFLALMNAAKQHAFAHGATVAPVLSPLDATLLDATLLDATLLGASPAVDVASLHAAGFRVIPWTTNDPAKMRALLALHVDGLISDYPNVLQRVVAEARTAAAGDAGQLAYLERFVVSAHRGGRGLRPENTLPSFESGMDNLTGELETDTGVSTDHVSLIWHDQFYNPLSCRRIDGKPYTMENRVYLRDLSMAEAQRTFVCDKLHWGPAFEAEAAGHAAAFPDQRNDLHLSPVAVAFAKHEGLLSPYVPTYAEQLFRFAAFYVDYYTNGAGKTHPEAAARAAHAARVRFNLETKILPPLTPEQAAAAGEPEGNHTVGPQVFVETLCGAIERNHLAGRAEVQSFDFRTLQLVEAQFPAIPTYYLTGPPATLGSALLPADLRQP